MAGAPNQSAALGAFHRETAVRFQDGADSFAALKVPLRASSGIPFSCWKSWGLKICLEAFPGFLQSHLVLL